MTLKLRVRPRISEAWCRGISAFMDYQPKTNIVKDENGDLVPVSYNSLARWRIHLSQFSECT